MEGNNRNEVRKKYWEQVEFGLDFIGNKETLKTEMAKKGEQVRLFPESQTWRDLNQGTDEKGEDESTNCAV